MLLKSIKTNCRKEGMNCNFQLKPWVSFSLKAPNVFMLLNYISFVSRHYLKKDSKRFNCSDCSAKLNAFAANSSLEAAFCCVALFSC